MAAESACRPPWTYYHILTLLCSVDGAAAAPAPKRPNVQMPDEYLPPNKILFLQNLPESVTKEQLLGLFSQLRHPPCIILILILRYPNLHEMRLIPTKRDIAFVEFFDEGSLGVTKEALHNYKLDGENKIKVCSLAYLTLTVELILVQSHRSRLPGSRIFILSLCTCCLSSFLCIL